MGFWYQKPRSPTYSTKNQCRTCAPGCAASILCAEERDLLPVRDACYDGDGLPNKIRLDVKARKNRNDPAFCRD